MKVDDLFINTAEAQMVIFTLGKEEYAVPITSVQEIIMPQELTKIPRSADFVEGVINLRGNIVPVINGCKRFQLACPDLDTSPDTRIVILDICSHILGLIVNDVSEVIKLTREQIDASPSSMGSNMDFLWGIAKIDKRLLILLNPEKFMDINELDSLKNITEIIQTTKTGSEEEKEEAKTSV